MIATAERKTIPKDFGLEPDPIDDKPAEIIKIDFEDGQLECCEHEGTPYASIRRVCEQIGIDYSGQLQKLKIKHWAVMEMISTTGSDGKMYEQQMISVKSLPMWLATINTEKVDARLRPTLEKYQLEAADVILNHFMPHVVEDHGTIEKPKDRRGRKRINRSGETFGSWTVVRNHEDSGAVVVRCKCGGQAVRDYHYLKYRKSKLHCGCEDRKTFQPSLLRDAISSKLRTLADAIDTVDRLKSELGVA